MATYTVKYTSSNGQYNAAYNCKDLQIYGAARVSIYTEDIWVSSTTFASTDFNEDKKYINPTYGTPSICNGTTEWAVWRGYRTYEHGAKRSILNTIFACNAQYKSEKISNHLGNVLATITDRKKQVDNNANNQADFYEPRIVSVTVPIKKIVYFFKKNTTNSKSGYAFGSVMKERQYTITEYKYAYNGKEKENETFEDCIVFEARIFDARLGRFLSTDPREAEYAWQSTYVYFKNCPIRILDYKGMGDSTNSSSLIGSLTTGMTEFKSTSAGSKNNWDNWDVEFMISRAITDHKMKEYNCALCCAAALKRNIDALYLPIVFNLNIAADFFNFFKPLVDAKVAAKEKDVFPYYKNKLLSTRSTDDEIKIGADLKLNICDEVFNQFCGVSIYGIGIAGSYHTALVVVIAETKTYQINGKPVTYAGSEKNPIYLFVEDGGGVRHFNTREGLENKILEFVIGARKYYRGELAPGGKTFPNPKSDIGLQTFIYRLKDYN